MDDIVDLLRIKIEKAKRELPLETVNAIDAVDWRTPILGLRSKYGYTFEQLGDLELETELLLCGLVSGANYPKELANRMKISKGAANELVNEMNNLVFKKIREELVKNAERKKILARSEKKDVNEAQILNTAGIEIIPEATPNLLERPELTAGEKEVEKREDILKKIENPEAHPILAQKLSSSFGIGTVETKHSLENITKAPNEVKTPVPKKPSIDPYREIPE